MIVLEDDFERLPLFALRGIVEAEVSLTHRITVIGFESNPSPDPQNAFPLRLKKTHCMRPLQNKEVEGRGVLRIKGASERGGSKE